jgi:hypothetical protein
MWLAWAGGDGCGAWRASALCRLHNACFSPPPPPPRPSTHAHALAHRKRAHTHATANGTKFLGIRNGIDNDIWNPTENVFLPMSFDAMTCDQGKRRCVRGMWTCGRCSC